MTRSSTARRKRRRQRGRPRKHELDAAEHWKIALAMALQRGWGLSERKAFDLVIAFMEAELKEAEMGRASFRLPYATISGRSSTLRQKKGAVHPDDEIVALATLVLQSRTLEEALQLVRRLHWLSEMQGAAAVAQAVRQLLNS
jgi:hypothetical protein